uniref:Flavin-containing monooxygenase n=1 Tax=Trichuris muris TaxID=70415 RepID=A0A5S6QUF7_TRIMR
MRVAIVGAGPSGIAAVKICRDYGFEPVCFDRGDDIGGLWYYTDEVIEGRGSVMKSTVINTSKEMTAFSDFPPRREVANFMHNTELMSYLREYADTFNIRKYIMLNTEVTRIEKTTDHDATGEWVVTTENLRTKEKSSTLAQAVLLCSGHHGSPRLPDLKGLRGSFEGQVMHSHSYRKPEGFKNKRVLVVGIGNSAMDIATELSRHACKVFLSTRRGAWAFSRTFHCGYPYDVLLINRFSFAIMKYFPAIASRYVEFYLNSRFDHALYGIRPQFGVFQAHPTISDELPSRVCSGTVVIKPDIASFTKRGVIFNDGSKENDIDVVILCTGYDISFPCLVVDVDFVDKSNNVQLYKNMYCSQLPHPETMAVIGLVQPWGSILPISEMQCRVACHLLAGFGQLPSREEMDNEMSLTQDEMRRRYVRSPRHTIQVDYVSYMDELSKIIGAKPDAWRYAFSDPTLAAYILWGPCTPYQYRLEGPHKWEGARQAIVEVWDRVRCPYKTSRITISKPTFDVFTIPRLLFVLLLIMVFTPLWVLFLLTAS